MKHCCQIPSPGSDVFSLRPLLLLLPLLLLSTRYADAQASPASSSNGNNPYGFSATFNPSMAIVIVVLISAFFFLGFFSIYIRRCGGGERIASIRGGGVAGRSRRNRGLDPEALATIPTFVYSDVKGLKIGKGELECAVCLSEFEDDETLRLLPRCSHVFHHDCIDAWLASHVTCPVCRSNLADASEIPAAAGTLAAESNVEEPVQAPEEREAQPEYVVIAVDEGAGVERKAELAELGRIANRMRAAGSRSGARPPRLPRSHSTGHSLALVHDNHDRFTLRLPDHVRREMVAAGRLKRSATTRPFPGELEGSSRRGYRGGEGSSRAGRSIRLGRSGRWPSSLARTISSRFSAFASSKRWDGEGSVKKGEGEGSARGRLRSQFDCLSGGAGLGPGAKSDVPAGNDESVTGALARV